jgi:hypothetical protein
MIRPVIIGCVLCFLSATAKGQSDALLVKIGYGWYDMTDMKRMQQSFIEQSSNIPLEVTDEFPPYFIAELQYLHEFEKVSIGGLLQTRSTGGRIHYGDYSGEALLNQELQAYSIGAILQINLVKKDHFRMPLYLKASYDMTTLDIHQELTVTGQTESESYKFKSSGFSLEPGLNFTQSLSRWLISLDVGYQFNFNGKLYLNDSDEDYLVDNNDEPLKAQWQGLRLALGVGFKF